MYSDTGPQIDYNYAKPIHILFLFSEHDSDIVEQSQISTADMFPTVDWIQNMAKAKQFSRRGEMFSADNLAILAEICFQHYINQCSVQNTLSAYVIKNDVFSLLTSYERMVDFFANNSYHQVCYVIQTRFGNSFLNS